MRLPQFDEKPASGVRGVRVLKSQGVVVNAAPDIAGPLASAASSLAAASLGVLFLAGSSFLPGSSAQAYWECGVPTLVNPIVICDGVNNGAANEPGEISVAPNSETVDNATHSSGIYYYVSGVTLNLDGTVTPFVVDRPTGYGVISFTANVLPDVINALGEVNVNAGSVAGITAWNNVGAATINYDSGTIVTTGNYIPSIYT